ncbi:TM2 domain-containing protein [Cyclobacterium amurskyense]|jgi:TM2 domain-containing membrane protein YozV|uniref:TM2 domain containing protein n=1 Tax=Cyclobacterium amurskyense TaxID=320787 RepID=A0A0H4PV13_9BACT|nr:TM2 domain-containing protein [Cyclobacterium amurskyense]AKP52202.1 TM2 domain containing protein [Cyclobacterium amurskyense]|tara:strand:- start:26252 stop:26629 length:378 start_codon:yes stop_codon:yes gene_type:complete
MANVLRHLPELEGMELGYIQGILKDMNEEQASLFAQVYRARRKDSQMILILTLIGFFGFAGLHRFILGQIGLGILYMLTLGLCFIGTIVDLVNYKSLTYEYNIKMAHETLSLLALSDDIKTKKDE